MIIAAGVLGIVFGGVIGWLVRDIMAYRPPSRRKRIALDDYWRSWPAMVRDLKRGNPDADVAGGTASTVE